MSLLSLCLCAVLVPQGESRSRLVLPPVKDASRPEPAASQASPLERFHRDVMRLRRSLRLSDKSRELILAHLEATYEDAAGLALRLAAKADADLMHGLLQVLRRFGGSQHCGELQFLVLTRPFGSATRAAVTTLAELAGEDAKEALLACLTSRYAGVRKAARDLLLARLEESDLPRILELSRDEREDVRRKALFLLGALPYPPARARLIEALSAPSPTLAAIACRSLIAHGTDHIADLQAIVSRAPLDRSFGYAAFALAQLENQTGRVLLPDAAVPFLRQELGGPDSFMRATAALALANFAFRSDDDKGFEYGDREIVDGLMLVVAPTAFVSNFDMLHKAAAAQIVRFTGQDFRGRAHAWRSWWRQARAGFVGMRLEVPVTDENGARAVLVWTDPGRRLRFRGERVLADPELQRAGAAAADDGRERLDFVLSGPEMASLVGRLKAQGFMQPAQLAAAAQARSLPVARTLELRLGSLRAVARGPAAPARWLDALESELLAVARRERWQLYPDPAHSGDFLEFWRAERRWLAEHADPRARERRLVKRILAALPKLEGAARRRALVDLGSLEGLKDLLAEADGLRLVRLAAAGERLDDQAFRLLEFALMAPGERVWREVLDAVDARYEQGGKEVLGRVFSLLGPDRVLAALADARPRIRAAAMLEVAELRDVRAVPALLAALDEPDPAILRTAIFALGRLRAEEARDKLVELAARAEAGARHAAWVALGRIGGEGVLPVLQAAAASPDLRDQLAAIQAMGELRDPRAAAFLAQVLAAHGLNPRGTQAMASLQKLGARLARPALRKFLSVRDPRVRREIVMLLAEFQDPAVVPDLISMLEDRRLGTRAALLLAGITGLDLAGVDDRARVMREWWARNKSVPQAVWFVQALRRNGIETDLEPRQLAPGAGLDAVEELTDVLLRARKPHLRVLAGAMLREVTGQEFGNVSMHSTVAQLRAIADRYRFFAEAERGRGGR